MQFGKIFFLIILVLRSFGPIFATENDIAPAPTIVGQPRVISNHEMCSRYLTLTMAPSIGGIFIATAIMITGPAAVFPFIVELVGGTALGCCPWVAVTAEYLECGCKITRGFSTPCTTCMFNGIRSSCISMRETARSCCSTIKETSRSCCTSMKKEAARWICFGDLNSTSQTLIKLQYLKQGGTLSLQPGDKVQVYVTSL